MRLPSIAGRAAPLLLLALAACDAAEGGPGAIPTAASTLVSRGATTPTIAADGRGGAFIAWIDATESLRNVYLARVDGDDRPVGAPVRVNDVPGDAAAHEQAPPQVVVGPGGEVYVVWQTGRTIPGRAYDASDLRFARSSDGGRTFGPALTVNDDAGGLPSSHTFHDVKVAGDGTVYVSWLDGREQDRARAAGTPPPPGSDIRIATWRPGDASFSASLVIDDGVCPCCRSSLAIGEEGVVLVAWRKVFEGNVRDVVVARSTDHGKSFSAPRAVHGDGWVFDGCPHAGPSLAFDGRGDVYVAWYTGREGRQGLYYAVSSDGGESFGAPEALLVDAFVPPSQVKLAPAAAGVWASWDDRRTTDRQTHLARLVRSEVLEVGTPGSGHSPAIASAGDAATLVWQEGEALRLHTARSP